MGEEIIHFFTHIEHGFLRTTKDLLTKPGAVQKGYLDGRRKIYHKPVSFLLIWVAIFLLVSGLTNRFGSFDKSFSSTFISGNINIDDMIFKYTALIEILILPFTALNVWLQIIHPKLSYLEVLVTGFYRFAVLYIFLSVQYTVCLIFGVNPQAASSIYSIAIIYTGWSVYVFYDFFKQYNVKWLVIRIITTISIGIVIYSFLRTMIAKLFIAWGF